MKKMNNRINRKSKVRRICLLSLLILAVLVGVFGIIGVLTSKGDLFELGLIRSETMGLLLVFLLALPLLLLLLALLWMVETRKKNAEEIKLVLDSPTR